MNLVEFLKRYSNASNDFIDDFFGMYNEKDKYNFCINIDSITKWLGHRKDNIKALLKESYIKNIDYKIIKKSTAKKVGKPSETILITPKCFKIMTMKGKSKRSDMVREFYYELEILITRYKNYIIEGLNQKIKALENNQRPRVNPEKGVIYILQVADGLDYYKLGRTKNLKQRLRAYNSDKKDDIIPIFIYETNDIDTVEGCVKLLAKKYQYRRSKEVYQADIDLLKDLIVKCADFNENVSLTKKHKPLQVGGNYCIAIYRQ